jgi:hypothetical protein
MSQPINTFRLAPATVEGVTITDPYGHDGLKKTSKNGLHRYNHHVLGYDAYGNMMVCSSLGNKVGKQASEEMRHRIAKRTVLQVTQARLRQKLALKKAAQSSE